MQKRTKAEWQELMEEYEGSGLSQRAWCETKGINIYTFRDRQSRIRKAQMGGAMDRETKATGIKQNKRLEPISSERLRSETVKWMTVANGSEDRKTEIIAVAIGDFKISVMEGYDEELFRRVCKSLQKLC